MAKSRSNSNRRRRRRRSGGGRLSRFGSRVGRSFRNLGRRMKNSAKRSKKYLRKKSRRLGRRFGYNNPSTVASIKSATNMPSMKSSMKSSSMKSASKMPSMSSTVKYGVNSENGMCTKKNEYTGPPYYESLEECEDNEMNQARKINVNCNAVMCRNNLHSRRDAARWIASNAGHEDVGLVGTCLDNREFCATTGSKRRSKKSKRRSSRLRVSKRRSVKRSKRRSGKRSKMRTRRRR